MITARRPTRRPATDPGPVALHPRNVRFDWAGVPLHWIPGDPVASHFITSLSLLLPAGERMFVIAFKAALGKIEDPELRGQVIGFIGQEGVHAESHDKLLWEFLDAHGIDPRPFVTQADFLFDKLNALTEHGTELTKHRMTLLRLAIIAGIEHFTAILGDWILNTDLEGMHADPTMSDLLRWHGAEEVEHRTVAHDVATYFHVGVVRRNIAFLLAAAAALGLIFRGTKFIVRNDPALPNYGYLRLVREFVRAGSDGSLPTLGTLAKATVRYMRPGYSPEVEGDTAQAVAYLAGSPAAKAALAAGG